MDARAWHDTNTRHRSWEILSELPSPNTKARTWRTTAVSSRELVLTRVTAASVVHFRLTSIKRACKPVPTHQQVDVRHSQVFCTVPRRLRQPQQQRAFAQSKERRAREKIISEDKRSRGVGKTQHASAWWSRRL